MKLMNAAAATLTVGLFLTACGNNGDNGGNGGEDGGEEISISFGHVISVGDSQDQAYEMFADLVDERSEGRIEVELYPDSQLGGESEMIEAVQAGQIEMTAPSVGVLANFDDALQIFDFPFVFEETETAHEVLDGDFGTGVLDDLEGSGLKALGWGENGWRHIAMSGEPVTTPDQMEGVSLRTMEVPLHIAYWESIGANPSPLAFPEVYTSLQQGVVEGAENPYELMHSAGWTEPADQVTDLGWVYDPEVILIGEDFFDELSEEDQQIIQESADEMIDELRSLKAGVGEEIRTDIEAEGGTVSDLSDEERQQWVDSAIPFYEEYASEVDTDKLIELLEEAGNDTYLDVIQ